MKCAGLCCVVFGPGDSGSRLARELAGLEKLAEELAEQLRKCPPDTAPDLYMRPNPFE